MKKIITILLCGILSSCTSFTKEEKELIYSDPNLPARVIKTNVLADSLLLRKTSKNVRKIENNKDLQALIQKLKLTMEEENGIGISAVQIGIKRNVFLFMRLDKPGKPIEIAINPKIISQPKETFCFDGDACLSILNQSGTSKRYATIGVEYRNEKGELIIEKLNGGNRLQDFTGVIFQHEYDHLKGILFIDKLCK